MVNEVRAGAGSVQLVSWGEARLVEDSQEAWGLGTLVGVEARADGTLALADPGPPVFNRSSVAYLSNGAQVAAGQPRFETVGGRTGVLVEEGTTNLRVRSDLMDNPASTGPAGEITVSTVNVPLLGYQTQVRRVSRTGSTTWAFAEWASGITVQDAHTISVYLRSDTLGANEQSRIELIEVAANPQRYTRLYVKWGSGGTISSITAGHNGYWSNPSAFGYEPKAEGWYRIWFVCPADVNPSMNPRVRIVPCDTSGAVTDKAVLVGGVQVEQKNYPTSLIPTSGSTATRAAETLTVPPAGVLYPQEGTMEAWVYVPSASFGRAAVLFDVRDSTGLNRLYFELSVDKKPTAAINKNATPYIARGPNPLSSGWHFVAITWSSTRLACYADGALVATYSDPPLLDAIATAALGSNTTIAYHFNSFIGPIRISRRARSDAEIAAAYAAGTLELDEDTTLLLPLSGSLAYGRGGYRIAPAVDLSRVGLVYASRLEWEADDAGVEVQTSLDGGQTWQQAQNGGPVPGIVPGQDVTGKTLLVKQRLLAPDMAAAPVLRRFDTRVIAEPRPAKHQGRVELLGGG